MDHEIPNGGKLPELPRRIFLRDAATVATVACVSPGLLLGCQGTRRNTASASINADAMDEALEMMSKLGPLTNHGPMAAEALVTLGRTDRVVSFVETYKKRFASTYPPPRQEITNDNWREALGDGTRAADWSNFFQRELKEAAWSQVLQRWSAALAPGLAAAAAHGLIRTGHAVRSLSARESELRRRELAAGLGYWAAYYQTLPATPGTPTRKLKPEQALNQVPILPSERRARGSIMAGLRSLNDFPPFASVTNLVDTTGKAEKLLSELTYTFATNYMKNVNQRNCITLIHTITSLCALRTLLPYLSPTAAESALRYGWQVGAGLYSLAGTGASDAAAQPKEIKRTELIERATASQEEHSIKFTEACLREYALNPQQVFLEAAHDAIERLGNAQAL